MTEIEQDVLDIVRAMAPDAGQPSLDDTFIGLGYTSLRFIELSIALERAFNLKPLTPEALGGIVTVGDLADLVRAQQDQS